jgi:acetolactate synthase small subunit
MSATLTAPPAATPTATPLPAPAALPHRRRPGTRHELLLVTADSDDVVARVLGLLARRGCAPCSVTYARGDRHRHGRLHLVVECRGGRPHKLGDWLGGLVDVLEVQV